MRKIGGSKIMLGNSPLFSNYKESKKLTKEDIKERQKRLAFLVQQASEYGYTLTQRDVVDNLPNDYHWSNKGHDHCSAIWKDIKDINESDDYSFIIIADNFTYRIGSKKDTEEYLKKLWDTLKPRLHRYWLFKKKLERNGEAVINYDKGVIERFIDAFPFDEDEG